METAIEQQERAGLVLRAADAGFDESQGDGEAGES